MPTDDTPVEIADNPAEHRFEVRYGDRLAGFTVYQEREAGWAFVHTEIADDLEGHGLASQLVRAAMDAMAARDITVVPVCAYVRSWLEKHPDHPVAR